jgi:hypothetical protein
MPTLETCRHPHDNTECTANPSTKMFVHLFIVGCARLETRPILVPVVGPVLDTRVK